MKMKHQIPHDGKKFGLEAGMSAVNKLIDWANPHIEALKQWWAAAPPVGPAVAESIPPVAEKIGEAIPPIAEKIGEAASKIKEQCGAGLDESLQLSGLRRAFAWINGIACAKNLFVFAWNHTLGDVTPKPNHSGEPRLN